MIAEGRVGPIEVSDGAVVPLRVGTLGALIGNDSGYGRYSEAVQRGEVFFASTQAGVALTTTLSTTATGFILTNPNNSGKKIVVLDAAFALASAPAGAATIGWAAQFGDPSATGVTHTTALTVRSALLRSGAAASVGLADSAATLPNTPVAIRWVPGGPQAASATAPAFIRDEVSGLMILMPGTSINTFVLTTAITVAITVYWAELDI